MPENNTNVRHETGPGSIGLTHVGTATVRLEVAGLVLLTDPVFDPPGSRYRVSRTVLVSHTNLNGPAVPAEEVGPVDVALVSHDHHKDNLDRAGRELLRTVPRVVTTTSGARRLRGRFGIEASGLAPWQSLEVPTPDGAALRITATPAQHGPRWMRAIVGSVIGFALEHPAWGGRALWISGDTVDFPGLDEVAERFRVGLAVVHLGAAGFGLTGPIRYTFVADDLVRTLRRFPEAEVVPVHYEGWSHFQEGRGDLEAALAGAGGDGQALRRRVRFVRRGERTEIPFPGGGRVGARSTGAEGGVA